MTVRQAGAAAARSGEGLERALAWWAERVLDGSAPSASGSPGVEGWLATTLPVSFVYGGTPSAELLSAWARQTETCTELDGRTRRTLRLQDPATGLVVTWEATTYAGHPAVTWLVTFANQGSVDTPLIETVRALDLTLATDCYDLVLHYALGGHATPDAFAPQVRCLRSEPAGPVRLASSGGRSSNGVLPYFNVEANWGGPRGLVVAIGWSGQWEALISRSRAAPPQDIEPDLLGPHGQLSAFHSLDRLRIEAGMEGVHLVLHPGEVIRTPRILLLPWEDTRWSGQNALRRFIHQQIAPPLHSQPPLPAIWTNFGIVDPRLQLLGAGRTHQEAIPEAAAMDVDYIVLDAGWYGAEGWAQAVGTYSVRTDVFPEGLEPVAAAVRREGKQFGLWFEPERVYEGTEVFREHRDWLFPTPLPNTKSYILNMGNPDARRGITAIVSGVIERLGIRWYRHDANANYLSVWRANDPPDRQGISEIRYIEGLYTFWRELMERHPGLYMEGCSSGGRRMDFEALRYHHSYWYTDWMVGDPAGMQDQVHGASHWLPGNYFNNVMGNQSAPTAGTRERRYAFWSALGGGINCSWRWFITREPLDRTLGRTWIAEFRALRHLAVGDFYPLLPHSTSEGEWLASQYDRPDLGEGMLVAFRRRHCARETVYLHPEALDPDATYVLRWQSDRREEEQPGAVLRRGLAVSLAEAPAHEVIHYRRK
ncbi:MAG: alpha-galactosidase [Chloroflexi bacterium]|nr:alpha-galactosidase [Chloroflexota bacterium]